MLLRPVSLFIGILAAVLASQLPEFSQQYRQRLGGTIDELTRQVALFRAESSAEKLSFDQGVERLRKNGDRLAQHRGVDIDEANVRLQRLDRQLKGFEQAGPFNRILVMLRDFDPETAEHALQKYEPAVPTTSEGLVTTLVGFFFGGGLARMLGGLFRRREPPAPAYAVTARALEQNRAEAIRLRTQMNKARLPRPGLRRDSREA